MVVAGGSNKLNRRDWSSEAGLMIVPENGVATRQRAASSSVQELLFGQRDEGVMSLVRLLGFSTRACGCVVGKYREVATSREIRYVEEKGQSCGSHGHRRNHTIAGDRLASVSPITLTTKAS